MDAIMNPIQYMMPPPPPQEQQPEEQQTQQPEQQQQQQTQQPEYIQTPMIIKTMGTFDYIFKPSTLFSILWFFLLYLLCFILLRNAQEAKYTFSKTVDLVVCCLMFLILFFSYFFVTPEERLAILKAASRAFFKMLDEPISIVPILFAMIVFYLCIFFLNMQSKNSDRSIFVVSVESILWILLVLMIIIDFFKLVLHIDAMFYVKEMMGGLEGLDMMSFLPRMSLQQQTA